MPGTAAVQRLDRKVEKRSNTTDLVLVLPHGYSLVPQKFPRALTPLFKFRWSWDNLRIYFDSKSQPLVSCVHVGGKDYTTFV